MSLTSSKQAVDAYVQVALAAIHHHVGKDAPRSKAARSLADWQHRDGLLFDGEDLTALVLDHFEADDFPKPGLDYLPARTPPALNVDDIGPLIKELRAAAFWSCERLAAEAGVTRAYVGLVENGDRIPHMPKLIALLDALECDLTVVKR